MEISLSDAWMTWLSGNQLNLAMTLYGVPFYWWGRAAKMLILLSALSVVLEIFGASRIRSWAQQYSRLTLGVSAVGSFAVGIIVSLPIVAVTLLTVKNPLLATVAYLGISSVVLYGSRRLQRQLYQFLTDRAARDLYRRGPAALLRSILGCALLLGIHFDLLLS